MIQNQQKTNKTKQKFLEMTQMIEIVHTNDRSIKALTVKFHLFKKVKIEYTK